MQLFTNISAFLPPFDPLGIDETTGAAITRIRITEWMRSDEPGVLELLGVWQYMSTGTNFRDHWKEYYPWLCCKQRERWFLDLAADPGWPYLEENLPDDAPASVREMLSDPYRLIFDPDFLDLAAFDKDAEYLAQLAYKLSQQLQAA